MLLNAFGSHTLFQFLLKEKSQHPVSKGNFVEKSFLETPCQSEFITKIKTMPRGHGDIDRYTKT